MKTHTPRCHRTSLAAAAALVALASPALAQSSVTIYGVVDLSLQHLRSGDNAPFAGASFNRLADGALYGPGSRLGFRVAEDLGAGLKARVVLESGLAADTGVFTQGGRAFGREAWLSLDSRRLGELRLGRQYMFHDTVMAWANPGANTTALNPGAPATLRTGGLPMFIDAPRVDNAVQVLSPMFGGVQLRALLSLGEGTMDRYHGLMASYASGPVKVATSYEWSKGLDAARGSRIDKLWSVGGNYDFGAFRLLAGLQRTRDIVAGAPSQLQIGTLSLPGLSTLATRHDAYTAGVLVPVGSTDLTANYTRARYRDAAGNAATLARAGAGATYSFSKRTAIYGTATYALGSLKDDINERQLYQLGLRHRF